MSSNCKFDDTAVAVFLIIRWSFHRAAPLIFGPLFNWALYGVLCVQIYVYSYNFPLDGRSIKFLAYFVFLLETAQTALTGADVYYWFNSHFAPIDIPIITAVISFIVQGQSSWICWIIAVVCIPDYPHIHRASDVFPNTGCGDSISRSDLWSIPSALADILIAIAMTLLVRHHIIGSVIVSFETLLNS
ncbi:hypothetical protein EDB92DRAFT_1888488 [Lactarius akahatsu]|uniref:Uncharacterized protein n=1 Tax=Lactarius akahatsu TaxID=416441 RepID=A0AAD4LED0_9AGAM|nr:hypothetical protein EDB92DRAFT_1888488 [Lactarius akahatsu]